MNKTPLENALDAIKTLEDEIERLRASALPDVVPEDVDVLRAKVEMLLNQNQEIAASNAEHVKWHRDMEAEVERLRAELRIATAGEGYYDLWRRAEARLTQVVEEVIKMRHHPSCRETDKVDCDCGIDAVLAAAQPEEESRG